MAVTNGSVVIIALIVLLLGAINTSGRSISFVLYSYVATAHFCVCTVIIDCRVEIEKLENQTRKFNTNHNVGLLKRR